MNSPFRIGLLAGIGTLVIGAAVYAVATLSSPPPAELPTNQPVTLQNRGTDDGSFSAPASPTSTSESSTAPASPTATEVAPPVESHTAQPPPQPDDDDDDDDDWDDDDVDDDD